MTIKTENWLGEYTSTIGTGDITLGGAIDGFAGFSNVGENVDVYYTVMDALDKETGIGTLTGGKLVRKDIHATLVDGAYVKNGSAINLSGDAQVYGTANAHFLDYVQAVANAEIVNTQAIAELKALQINGHALTASFNLTAADVGAHPDSWMPSTDALNVYQKAASDIRYLKTQDAEQVAGLVMRVGGACEQQLQQSINDVSTAFIGDAPPAGAPVGKRWFDTESGRTYIKYNDGDSTQWVEESPQGLSPDGLESRIDEALRRSYAEAGYNLVDGSFEAGGTLVNANDVLLQERTGKAFTGPAGIVAAGTNPASGGFIDRSGEVLINKINMNSNNGFVGSVDVSSSILILGDSITEAVGASTYANGYSYQLARSLLNHRDKGYSNDSGFYWHTDINQANAVNTGLSSNGTIVSGGVTAKRRSLAVGQSINITGRKFNSVYIVYDGATSSGSIEIQRNGVVISTQAVVGSSLNVTNVVVNNWSEGDSLSVVAVGGTVVVCGVMTLKTAAGASLVHIAGRSGAGYQDFTTASAIDEIGYWLNLLKAGNEKVLVLNAGTNNIYNSGKAKTPNELVSEISTLISGVNSKATSVKYVIAVPPKANESIFPIVRSGFAYEDYVSAIVNFANQNGHGLIRYDLTWVSKRTSYYSDGVHPSNVGHRIMAAAACEAFGVPLNSYVRVTAPTVGVISQVDVTMSSSWGPFNGAVGSRGSAQLQNNTASLFGIVQPNGSTSLTIGVIPAGYRPTRSCYFVARANTGPVNLTITSGGELVVDSIPTWLSLEGVTYAITRV